jgi:hypothetical protein
VIFHRHHYPIAYEEEIGAMGSYVGRSNSSLKPSVIPNAPLPSTQLTVIVLLFVIMRLTILFLYSPQGILNFYTDYHFYYQTAQLSENGNLPFINMWFEYPPLLAYMPQIAYWITRWILPLGDAYSFTFIVFSRILGTFLLVFETGVLILVHRIAAVLWGLEKADRVAWIYSGLSLPLFFWSFSHQSVVVFFSLLAVYGFLLHREASSALALGLGIAAKFLPVLFLAPIIRFLWPKNRSIARFGLIAFSAVFLVYLPFLLGGGASWISASFRALIRISPWGTPWAILDGNWGPGYYGPLSTRLQMDWPVQNLPLSPGVVSGWIPLLLLAAIYGWLFFRTFEPQNPKHFFWFSALTLVIFYLYSKGWSPQWCMLLIPFFLLSFPDGLGLRLCLLLTGLVFLEWPIATILDSHWLSGLIILGRTLLLVYAGILLAQQIWFPSLKKDIALTTRS